MPVSVTPFVGHFRDGTPVKNRYVVKIPPGLGQEPRTFVGFFYPLNWEGQPQPCIYVGNTQGGPGTNVAGFTDGVLEGTHGDYLLSGPFAEKGYIFGLFDEAKC